jgi:ATP/maltotriose-dependent transcriptional regulator MalT
VMLARAVHAQGRLDAAFELTVDAEREADVHDISPRFGWRAVRAAIYAQRGELGEARRLADEAIALVAQTDWQRDHADTLLTRAEVLGACGETTAAAEALQDALALYERKGCTVSAERVRTMLALHQTT